MTIDEKRLAEIRDTAAGSDGRARVALFDLLAMLDEVRDGMREVIAAAYPAQPDATATVREVCEQIDTLHDAVASAEKRAVDAERSLSFSREWYAVRWERLRDLLRGTTHEQHACAIMANGTTLRNDDGSFSAEPPTYAQLLSTKEWRAEAAEKRAEDAERKFAALLVAAARYVLDPRTLRDEADRIERGEV